MKTIRKIWPLLALGLALLLGLPTTAMASPSQPAGGPTSPTASPHEEYLGLHPSGFPVGTPICVRGHVRFDGQTPYLDETDVYSVVLNRSDADCRQLMSKDLPSYTEHQFMVTHLADGRFVVSPGWKIPTNVDSDGKPLTDFVPVTVTPDDHVLDELYAVERLPKLLKPGEQRYINGYDLGSGKHNFGVIGDITTTAKRYKDDYLDMAGISVLPGGDLQLCVPKNFQQKRNGFVTRAIGTNELRDPDEYLKTGYYDGQPVRVFYPKVVIQGQGCKLPVAWSERPRGYEAPDLQLGKTGYGPCGFFRTPDSKVFYQVRGNPLNGGMVNTQYLNDGSRGSVDSGPLIRYVQAAALTRNADGSVAVRVVPESCRVGDTTLYPMVNAG